MSYESKDGTEEAIVELAQNYGVDTREIAVFDDSQSDLWIFRKGLTVSGVLGHYPNQDVYYLPINGKVIEVYDADKSSALAHTEERIGRRFPRVAGRFVVKCMDDFTQETIKDVERNLEAIMKKHKLVK